MQPNSKARKRTSSRRAGAGVPRQDIVLQFDSDHVGVPSIDTGLRNLEEGLSTTETWIIAGVTTGKHPDRIIGKCTMALHKHGRRGAWCYVMEGKPVHLTLPKTTPPVEYLRTQMGEFWMSIAAQHAAWIFRLEKPHVASINVPDIFPLPHAVWNVISTRHSVRRSGLSAVLRRMRRALRITADEALEHLERNARLQRAIGTGGDWLSTESLHSLPLVTTADRDRIVRGLRAHIEACAVERVRHGAAGKYDDARAMASEEAATHRLIELIVAPAASLGERAFRL